MGWSTETQFRHLSIWPHFTGMLSMIGSSLIIYEVLRDPGKRKKVYHRLLLAMSLCDLNTSFWYFLSTWPIPKGTAKVYQPSGTMASCTAQGFFIQFGISTPLYNTVLAMYYLFIIRFGWKEKRVKAAEKYFHALPLLWAAGTSLAALGLGMLNNANLWCWIAPLPLTCVGSHRNDGVNDCERGNNAWIFRWAFFYGPLWAAIGSSGVAMWLTYLAVRKTEKASARWSTRRSINAGNPDGNQRRRRSSIESLIPTAIRRRSSLPAEEAALPSENDRKHSKQVATQAFYYLLAFFFSWTPATLTRFIQMVWGRTYYPIILLMAILTPMQGFLNYTVYMRPRWISYRKKHPEWNVCQALLHLLTCKMLCRRSTGQDVEGEDGEGRTRKRGSFLSAIPTTFSRRSSHAQSECADGEQKEEEKEEEGEGDVEIAPRKLEEDVEIAPRKSVSFADEREHAPGNDVGHAAAAVREAEEEEKEDDDEDSVVVVGSIMSGDIPNILGGASSESFDDNTPGGPASP
ncbi:hypothetical protein ACHAWF_004175 [Thalassiosira exigua]